MNTNQPVEALSTEKELRRYLGEHLPDYMIPKLFVFLDEMPLTRNGKIDRTALLSLRNRQSETNADYRQPQTQLERVIAEVWRKLLGIEKLGVDENFFEVGGHSLLLVEVSKELRKELTCDVSIVSLFQYPTIELLAEHLSREPVEEDLLGQARRRTEKREHALRGQRKPVRVRRNNHG